LWNEDTNWIWLIFWPKKHNALHEPLYSWKVSLKSHRVFYSMSIRFTNTLLCFYLYQKHGWSYTGGVIFGSTHISHSHQRAKHLVSEEQLNTAKIDLKYTSVQKLKYSLLSGFKLCPQVLWKPLFTMQSLLFLILNTGSSR
jgi:hypothetical protein